MHATGNRRALRWFWTLTAAAVLSMGVLHRGLHAAPGPRAGLLVGASTLVLAASGLQAARIWLVLSGPPRAMLRLKSKTGTAPTTPRGLRLRSRQAAVTASPHRTSSNSSPHRG